MKKNNNGYYTNRHGCFLLQYHLVLVTKYRHPVIKGEIEKFLKNYIIRYMNDRELPVIAMECMPDYIHLLFEAPPQLDLGKFINALKSASSRIIRKNFQEELKSYYWKPYFWSLSFFIGTDSEKTTTVIKEYIRKQEE